MCWFLLEACCFYTNEPKKGVNFILSKKRTKTEFSNCRFRLAAFTFVRLFCTGNWPKLDHLLRKILTKVAIGKGEEGKESPLSLRNIVLKGSQRRLGLQKKVFTFRVLFFSFESFAKKFFKDISITNTKCSLCHSLLKEILHFSNLWAFKVNKIQRSYFSALLIFSILQLWHIWGK